MKLTNVNLIVSVSNLIGLIPFIKVCNRKKPPKWKQDNRSKWIEVPLIGSTILASTLMHLTETKHNLPGLFLQKYSNHFLWLDRITAISSGAYLCYRLYKKRKLLNLQLVSKAVVGLTCVILSETVVTNPIAFMILHSLWHGFAYSIMDDVL